MGNGDNRRHQQHNEPLAVGLAWILLVGLVLVLQGMAGPWVAFALVTLPAVVFIAVKELRDRD
ncbi:hypothetical protein J7E88_16265 [Streptomyces sp. ISL-10]|uniref:hypothetical protein n=1 Tax=Streptomyces sp. ISL-10 TaxID=2819172 RepID=UPI001BE6A05E|nr:hypothetical protein [Streptomyces sp. ISL-10]MBT2366823.1 hypothetical protein [Streptomyces sp. ISL-10]